MKTRIFFGLAIPIASVLLLILTLTVAAQGSTVEGSSQALTPDKVTSGSVSDLSGTPQNGIGLGYTSEITFTPVVTSYLPIMLYDSGRCLAFPTLLSPANGSNLNTITPILSWDNGSNPPEAEFRLEAALDSDFSHLVYSLYSFVNPGVHVFRFAHNFSPATTYYWRAWYMCGENQGPYSEMWSFTTGSDGTILPAPTLLAPDNGSTVPTTTVNLQWSPVDGTVEYLVHWRVLGQGGSTYAWVNDTQYTIYWFSANTTYEWWVSARNDYAIGTDSETWQFTTPAGISSVSPQNLNHSFVIENGNTRITLETQDKKK